MDKVWLVVGSDWSEQPSIQSAYSTLGGALAVAEELATEIASDQGGVAVRLESPLNPVWEDAVGNRTGWWQTVAVWVSTDHDLEDITEGTLTMVVECRWNERLR